MLENGNILYQQGWQKIVEVTPEKKSVWEYDAGKMNGNAGKRVEVHAFQRAGNLGFDRAASAAWLARFDDVEPPPR